jgi:hypothetical protein
MLLIQLPLRVHPLILAQWGFIYLSSNLSSTDFVVCKCSPDHMSWGAPVQLRPMSLGTFHTRGELNSSKILGLGRQYRAVKLHAKAARLAY